MIKRDIVEIYHREMYIREMYSREICNREICVREIYRERYNRSFHPMSVIIMRVLYYNIRDASHNILIIN